MKNATQISTRAVTIDALPEEIWPWLVQMGQGRGGAYSYDWIENLMGLDIHSANNIIPELQTLEVGDTIPLEPGGTGLLVESMEPNKYLLLKYPDGGWTWFFGLYPLDKTRTRLVIRNRWTTVHFKFAKRAWFALTCPSLVKITKPHNQHKIPVQVESSKPVQSACFVECAAQE